MNLIILISAGLLVVLAQLWRLALWQPSHAWQRLATAQVKTAFDPLVIWKHLARWKWWSSPGFVVKTLSLKPPKKILQQSGVNLTVIQFYGLKQWLWSTGSLGFVLWLWFVETSLKSGLFLLFTLGLVLILPDLFLLGQVAQRKRTIAREVPYFLDLLTLTLQGGGNLEQGLVATTQNYQGELSRTVADRLKELEWGRSLDDVFSDLKTEIEDEDFRHFLNSLLRAKKLGASLSETLAIQAELLRTRRRQQAEELSRTAAVKISVPLVLFIFPALLIIYIGPGILQLLERT